MNSDQSRRSFLKKGIATLGGAAAVGALPSASWASVLEAANPLGLPLGCQTYPVRVQLKADHIGTFRQLGELGYRRVELCSPYGYAAQGFDVLAKYSGAQLRQILIDQGLRTESCHFMITELRGAQLDKSIAWAKDVGLTQMMIPTLNGPQPTPTMAQVRAAADEFNQIAEKIAAAGMVAGIHNEGFELTQVDGRRTYDVLIENTHPQNVKFQFQVSTISRGYEAVDYLTRYPNRFISMHVQDWDATARQTTAVGRGSLDWRRIFTAAKNNGAFKNYFVELNMDFLRQSAPYLAALQV